MVKRLTGVGKKRRTAAPITPPVSRKKRNIKAQIANLKRQSKALPQKRHGGPPAKRQTSKLMKRVLDRHEVLQMKARGLSYHQIAEHLGTSRVTAMNLAYQAAGELMVEDVKQAKIVRVIEGQACDEVRRAMIPLVHGRVPAKTRVVGTGKEAKTVPVPHDPLDVARIQTQAAQRLINVSARQAALYGADAPIKVTATDLTGTRRYAELSDDELLAERTRLAALLGSGVIDVTPGDNGTGDS